MLYLDSLLVTMENFLLKPDPNIVKHGISSIAQKCANQLQRSHTLAIFLHAPHYFRFLGEFGEVRHELVLFLELLVGNVLR